jgi:hypothetical protein
MIFLGCLLILLYYIPYLFLKENSYIVIHDNLDSEFVYKVLASKFPFTSKYDMIMNGLPSFCLPSKITLTQIYYYFLTPFYAYLINDIVVKTIAFVGMFLLINNYIFNKKYVNLNFLISFSFCLIPFYSIFGLSSSGIPLLLFCFLGLLNNNRPLIIYYVYIFIFSFYSSFALVGFFILAILLFYIFYKNKSLSKNILISFFLITIGYFISEYELFYSFFSGFASHRTEWKVNDITLMDNIRYINSIFFTTQYHTGKFYTSIVLFSVFLSFLYKYKKNKKLYFSNLEKYTIIMMFFIFSLCFIYPYIQLTLGNRFKILISFDFTRFYFFTPCLWFILFAYSIKFIFYSKFINTTYILIILNFFLIIFSNSLYAHNIYTLFTNKTIKNDLRIFNNYYDVKLFKQVSDYIGKPQSTYRIANLGFSPSISQYNGFYTIDSYQNVYPLYYKKLFRNIISNELNNNKEWKDYFDNWGSRVYLYTLPLPIETDHLTLDINPEAMKNLNCNFIISNIIIDNYKTLNLKYLRNFQDSTYTLYLYEIK